MLGIVVFVGLLLAYVNGANDNFKGVATLIGSGTTSYRGALVLTTVATALGSVAALFFAQRLLRAFTGKGLVPGDVVADPTFPVAVGLAAGLTVLLATRVGFPISTTHALIGALVGAGMVVSPVGIDQSRLAGGFLLPLLTSPLLAVAGAAMLYPPLRYLRQRLGVTQESCICVGQELVAVVPGSPTAVQSLRSIELPAVATGTEQTCRVRYRGSLFGLRARPTLDALHYLSAAALCFARGTNDTPKIAALLLAGQWLAPTAALGAVGVAIAVGGMLSARRVAETMSHRLTVMNPGQGLAANLVTAVLVIGASRWGVPVSTTHVSCGSLFGIGAVTGQAHWKTIAVVLAAWVTTLPLAAALGAFFAFVTRA